MPGKKGGGGASSRRSSSGSIPSRTYKPSSGYTKPANTAAGKAQRRRAANEKTPGQVRDQQARNRRRKG